MFDQVTIQEDMRLSDYLHYSYENSIVILAQPMSTSMSIPFIY